MTIMYDAGKVILGIVVFLALVTFPLWYNLAGEASVAAPVLEKAQGTQCVEDTEWMRARHMDLLNDWRDEVVRDGERYFVGPEGQRMEKSLSNTCLSCHVNKDKFCDRCHNYMSVDPYCRDCHVIPKEVM